MSLVDEFSKASKEVKKKGPVCTVCSLLTELNESDSAALKTELSRNKSDARYLTGRQISEVLERNNIAALPPHRIVRCRREHHGSV